MCAAAQPRQKWKTWLTIGDVTKALRPGIRVVGTAHCRPAVDGAVAVAKGGGAVAEHRVKHAVDAVGNFIGVAGHGGRRVGLCGGRRTAAVALLCTPRVEGEGWRGAGLSMCRWQACKLHATINPRNSQRAAESSCMPPSCTPLPVSCSVWSQPHPWCRSGTPPPQPSWSQSRGDAPASREQEVA